MMNEKVPVRTAAGTTKMRRIEALLHKVFELALKGNPRAQAQLLNLYAESVPEAPPDTRDGGEVDEGVAMLQELTIAFLKGSVTEN